MSTPNFRNQRDVVADDTLSAGVSSVINRALIVTRVTDPATANATAALTVNQTFAGLLTSTHATGATITLTTPTALALYQACPLLQVGDTFELTIVNLAGGAGDTVTFAGGTDVTTAGGGAMIIAISTSATFQIRFTGGTVTAPTFQVYRTA